MSMWVFEDSRTIASTTLEKPFSEVVFSSHYWLSRSGVEHLSTFLEVEYKAHGDHGSLKLLHFQDKDFFNADANFVRTKFTSKSTDNLCHCWNSSRYCRGPLFSNVNELALAPCEL